MREISMQGSAVVEKQLGGLVNTLYGLQNICGRKIFVMTRIYTGWRIFWTKGRLDFRESGLQMLMETHILQTENIWTSVIGHIFRPVWRKNVQQRRFGNHLSTISRSVLWQFRFWRKVKNLSEWSTVLRSFPCSASMKIRLWKVKSVYPDYRYGRKLHPETGFQSDW